jgi:1-acyl-sn-glycerol-3-phosphate acyltransferase
MGLRFLLRHAALRRIVTITLLLLFIVLTLVLYPIIVVFTGPFALRSGARSRPIRFGTFLVVYLAAEVVGLLSAVWVWLRLGIGASADEARLRRYQDANYALLARLLNWLYAAGAKTFGLRISVPELIESDGSAPAAPDPAAAVLGDGPLIVLSRHGGPGDSFLLVHALLVYAHRRPLIVLKDTLAFDPLIDVSLSRVPHCFITPRHPVGTDPDPERAAGATDEPAGPGMAESIGLLAAGMGPSDALLVFPEGANFTVGRRQRVIARLRRQGRSRAARRAQRLRNVLPPHPSGVFAAIDGAPGARLVFVAHTGLDHMQSAAEVWQGVPLDRPAVVTWWTEPAAAVPAQPEARQEWLHDNWTRVDSWISRAQTEVLPEAQAEVQAEVQT